MLQWEVLIKIEKYLKNAFCIDGSVNLISPVQILGLHSDLNLDSMMYEMNDSKRGVFYVTLSYEKEMKENEN